MRFLWRSQIERGKTALSRPEKKVRRSVPRKTEKPSLLLSFLWLLLCGTIVYTLLFAPFLLIDTGSIKVRGTDRLSPGQVHDFVREDISGRWLHLLPKNNFLLLRPPSLAAKLSARFPLSREVAVTRMFPRGLAIDIWERERIILWCSGGPCYLVTEGGMTQSAEQALAEENRDFVRKIIDTSAQPVRLGQRLFSFDLPGFIAEWEPLAEAELGMRMDNEYEAASRFAGELRVKTAEGFRIYVSTGLAPSKTIAALRLLFAKELPEEKRRELEYIDARTENRLYYRMRKSEEAAASGGSSVEEKKDEEKKKD